MESTTDTKASVCTSCGACCASFRVSLSKANELPDSYVERINERFSCMVGTNSSSPYCVALTGTVGESVKCSVYQARSSACREVMPGDGQCQKARAKHGLPPFAI